MGRVADATAGALKRGGWIKRSRTTVTTAAAMALSSKSFGMVNLKGTYLFGKGLAEAKFKFDKHFNPALNKETHRVRLTIPGAQIIGFITDEVPKSPNPDPKYSFDK